MEVTKKTNPVLECCSSLFALVAPFKESDRGGAIAENYREQILAAFDELERMAFEKQLTSQIVREAKYAISAYIDEVVLSSDWPGRLDWMSRPLQLEFFGEHLAGEGFFEHLAQLRQGGEKNLDLLELYYVCLQLGFEGVYRMRGLEQLMALQVDLQSQIDGYHGVCSTKLSPQGLPRETLFDKARREVPFWVIGVVTTGIVFFTFLGYSVAIDNIADSTVSEILSLSSEIAPNTQKQIANDMGL